ncbi:DUF3606 domain-containing protein [Planctomicrobium sp. SH664]|uniref:DUF3606 domain-containing protein n=1 Tax=Planctomicrobium sp. SH664 TaxID=3448125 RepID=UPI003F5AEC2A
MADDKTKKGPQDAARVNINEAYEVEYWTKKFGVSADTLKSAVKSAGPMVKDLEAHFRKK